MGISRLEVAWEFLIGHWEIFFVLLLVALMLVAFATEILPMEITALSVLVALAVTKVINVEDALSGFSSTATITVLMMFILSAAVLQSGIVDWLGDKGSFLMGRSTMRHIIVLGLLVGPISAFINNTAAVAVMIPFVVHMANKMGESPSRLLIPLSFAAMLGGMMTLIGTSTNLLGSAIRSEYDLGRFGMFEFSQAGVIIFAVGLLYLAVVGKRLIPERVEARKLDERYHLRNFLFEVEIPEKSNLINKRVGKSELTQEYDAEILVIHRGDKHLDPLSEPVYFQAGDGVLMRATRANLQRMADRGIIRLTAATGQFDLEKEDMDFRELLVTSTSTSRGKRLGRLQFWRHNHVHPVALLHRGRATTVRLYNRRLRTGDVVLVSGTKEDIANITGGDAFHVLGGPEPPLRRPHKVPHVLLILVAVVGLAALEVFPIVITATAGAVLMVATGALRITEMYEGVRWDIILLLAGIIPLGIALQETGTAAIIGGSIASTANFLPPLAVLALFFLITSVLTSIISNNASVVLMVPIGIEIALIRDFDPIAFILAAMFAASTSFLSPIGYQTNLMVMGPGGYRYLDFLKVGGPLTLLLTVVTPVVLNLFWPLV